MPENSNSVPTEPQEKPQPADLDAFDLDGFIAGVVQPTKVVAIAQDRTLGQQVQEAMQEVIHLRDLDSTAKLEGRPSKRRAATAESPELEEARARLAELEERAESTFIYVKVTALTRRVRKVALKEAATSGTVDQDAYNISVLSHCGRVYKVDPRSHPDAPGHALTAEQWDELSEAIGHMQWDALLDATIEVSNAGVLPDFSQPASPSPAGGMSSKS